MSINTIITFVYFISPVSPISCHPPRLPLADDALYGPIPISAVAFVAAIDLLAAALGQLQVRLDVHELAQGGVQRKAVHPVTCKGDHELSGSAIPSTQSRRPFFN